MRKRRGGVGGGAQVRFRGGGGARPCLSRHAALAQEKRALRAPCAGSGRCGRRLAQRLRRVFRNAQVGGLPQGVAVFQGSILYSLNFPLPAFGDVLAVRGDRKRESLDDRFPGRE